MENLPIPINPSTAPAGVTPEPLGSIASRDLDTPDFAASFGALLSVYDVSVPQDRTEVLRDNPAFKAGLTDNPALEALLDALPEKIAKAFEKACENNGRTPSHLLDLLTQHLAEQVGTIPGDPDPGATLAPELNRPPADPARANGVSTIEVFTHGSLERSALPMTASADVPEPIPPDEARLTKSLKTKAQDGHPQSIPALETDIQHLGPARPGSDTTAVSFASPSVSTSIVAGNDDFIGTARDIHHPHTGEAMTSQQPTTAFSALQQNGQQKVLPALHITPDPLVEPKEVAASKPPTTNASNIVDRSHLVEISSTTNPNGNTSEPPEQAMADTHKAPKYAGTAKHSIVPVPSTLAKVPQVDIPDSPASHWASLRTLNETPFLYSPVASHLSVPPGAAAAVSEALGVFASPGWPNPDSPSPLASNYSANKRIGPDRTDATASHPIEPFTPIGTRMTGVPTANRIDVSAPPQSIGTPATNAAATAVTQIVSADPERAPGVDLLLPEAIHSDGLRPARLEMPIAQQPGQSLTARADLARQIAVQLTSNASQTNAQPVELRLNPEELGRVRLALTPIDGTIIANISAERSETVDLLRRHISLLETEFREIGFADIQFFFGSSGHGGNDPNSSSDDPALSPSATNNGDDFTNRTQTPKTSSANPEGLDLRL